MTQRMIGDRGEITQRISAQIHIVAIQSNCDNNYMCSDMIGRAVIFYLDLGVIHHHRCCLSNVCHRGRQDRRGFGK